MATQMGWAFLFAPTGAFTLEANVLFDSYAKALAYARTDATAVVGKVISVVNDGVYTIEAIGENGALKKVGADIDLSNYVTKDLISSIFTYKGSVDKYTDLPTDALKGDVWNIKEGFELTDELGGTKVFPAGTNVAFDGTGWDTLAGDVDLSAYITKAEVTEIETNLQTSINGVASDLALTNQEVAKKVNAVEGSSLITAEKLALIDTNAEDIQALENQNLDSRISTLEGMFKDGDTNIDLSGISESITDHTNRLVTLESDNTTNKSNITTLQGQVQGHGERLTAIETLNTEQSTQISGLTTRVEAVESHGTAISNLTTTVNGHTQDISDIKSSISGLAVKSVASEEKVLAADANGALSTTIKLGYDAEKKKIQLKGISDAIVDELDATVFVKDGMLSEASYDTDTKEIVLTWNTDAGKEATRIPMASLVDTYTAGSGLKVENNEFAIKLDTNNNNKLTVSESGLLVDISSDMAALEDTMDNKIEAAFSWQNVE